MTWLHRASLAIWLTLAALGAAGSAHAQESAVVKRATQLRDAPADTGASVAPLEANTTVTRSNERKGAWTRVTTPQGATGWVHMFDLGPASGSATRKRRSTSIFAAPSRVIVSETIEPPRSSSMSCPSFARQPSISSRTLGSTL